MGQPLCYNEIMKPFTIPLQWVKPRPRIPFYKDLTFRIVMVYTLILLGAMGANLMGLSLGDVLVGIIGILFFGFVLVMVWVGSS